MRALALVLVGFLCGFGASQWLDYQKAQRDRDQTRNIVRAWSPDHHLTVCRRDDVGPREAMPFDAFARSTRRCWADGVAWGER